MVLSADGDLLEINYMMCYAYNGAHTIGPACLGIRLGAHDGDWEHITVRCDLATGTLIAVYFSAHRNGDGVWVNAEQLAIDKETGRIAVDIARDGHGCYAKPGTSLRIFGLANDQTAATGLKWQPSVCHVVLLGNSEAATLGVVADRGTLRRAADASKVPAQLLERVGKGAPQPAAKIVEAPWFAYRGKWGTVNSPSQQVWVYQAEHPTGSTTFMRWLLPCITS